MIFLTVVTMQSCFSLPHVPTLSASSHKRNFPFSIPMSHLHLSCIPFLGSPDLLSLHQHCMRRTKARTVEHLSVHLSQSVIKESCHWCILGISFEERWDKQWVKANSSSLNSRINTDFSCNPWNGRIFSYFLQRFNWCKVTYIFQNKNVAEISFLLWWEPASLVDDRQCSSAITVLAATFFELTPERSFFFLDSVP